MSKQIKNMEDWELGIGYCLQRGCLKELELHFDYMKSVFMDALKVIHDLDLIEQVHENIFSNEQSQRELDRIMNLITHNHREQKRRNTAV